ncbi:uncharacterized protein LOC124170379 [Ischnura elegans]|uniref:uncharacterized protein LOC124170379 n=1 Tax=Ischnura elegans TaxID=197161 RepID=UPI001ED86B8C|nr:uncharacterized protein LOC124170379 [Ischnura elegans]
MNRSAGIFTASSERDSVGTLCRLCMKNNDYYYNIFTFNVACRMTVKDAIYGLLGLEVAVGDGLPTTLCPLCLKQLTEFSIFKMTSLQSDAKLRKLSGVNCFRSIQGDEATDDELGSSADTKDFIQNEIEGTSHLTHSVQRTEIYIPVPDSYQFRDNILVPLKEEDKDPLSEGNYPVMYTPNPAGMSSNCLDPLATDDLSGMATCGSPSVKADEFSDDGGGYAHSNSTIWATNDLVSQASDQPTVTENGELIQKYTTAMEFMTEDVESPAPERASALFSVLEPKMRASHSRKRKDVMDKDTNKCDNLLADQITSCSIPNDGRLHSKSRYVYKIGGNRATTTNAEKRGGCDNADTTKFSRSTDNGKNDPEAIIRENKVKSTYMINNPGNCASSTKNSYHCFICRDVFNAKHDLINHLKIHFGSANYFRVKLKLPGGNPVFNLAQVYRDAVHIRDLVEGRSTRRSIQCGG